MWLSWLVCWFKDYRKYLVLRELKYLFHSLNLLQIVSILVPKSIYGCHGNLEKGTVLMECLWLTSEELNYISNYYNFFLPSVIMIIFPYMFLCIVDNNNNNNKKIFICTTQIFLNTSHKKGLILCNMIFPLLTQQ